jgi:hypothetical protein
MSYFISGYDRAPDDHYPTIDHRLVDQLARNFKLSGRTVWEPCPGEHDLSKQIHDYGGHVYETRTDFFAITAPPFGYHALITNPPYKDAQGRRTGKFIAHALDIAPRAWVIILVRWSWLGGAGTRSGKADLIAHPRFYALTMPDCRPIWNRSMKANPIHAFTWLAWSPARNFIKPKQPLIWL